MGWMDMGGSKKRAWVGMFQRQSRPLTDLDLGPATAWPGLTNPKSTQYTKVDRYLRLPGHPGDGPKSDWPQVCLQL